MKKIQLFFALVSLLALSSIGTTQAQQEHFFIGYWNYTQQGSNSVNEFALHCKQMKEHHINHVIPFYYLVVPNFIYASSNPSKAFLDSAYNYGINVLLNTPENSVRIRYVDNVLTWMNPYDYTKSMSGLAYYGNHPAVKGFIIQDEPYRNHFQYMQLHAQDIQAFNPNLMRFVNLLPNYADTLMFASYYPSTWSYDKRYEQFIQDYIDSLQPQILSFDNYPFYHYYYDSIEHPHAYYPRVLFMNMDIIARKSAENNVPFTHVLTSLKKDSVHPNGGEYISVVSGKYKTSYSIYTSLLYGAKGYSFWNSTRSLSALPGHNDIMRSINKKVIEHEEVLLSLNFKSVYHKSFYSTVGPGEEIIPEHSKWDSIYSDSFANEIFNINNPLIASTGSSIDSLAISFMTDNLGNRYFWLFNKSMVVSENIRLN